ncbi:hypothetical protein [Streptomyces formicae]
MNKNIRRSLVIAAGVTSAWALGSAVASADELPQHSIAVPDQASDAVADVQGKTTDVTDGSAVGQVKKVATGAAAKVKSVDTAPTVDTDQVKDKLPTQDELPTQDKLPAPDALPTQDTLPTQDDVQVPDVQAPDTDIDYLFGPLSAFAPDLEGAVSPVVDQTSASVLPPVAATAVTGVRGVTGDITPGYVYTG